jgi:hypothetical protein
MFVAAVCGGCSSSSSTSSGGAGNDMDKIATAVGQHSAASKSSTIATKSASVQPQATTDGGAGTTAANTIAPPPAPADPSLASKRGFDLKDWNDTSYILVKTNAAKTAEALAGAWKGKVIKNALGTPTKRDVAQIVVYQLAGHPWTVFAHDDRDLKEVAKQLSRTADVLAVWQSDFNGWSGVELYRGGEEVEAVHWGPDEDKLAEDADAAKWQARAEVARKNEDETYNDAFLFRSKLRKVATQDLQKGDAFIEEMFRAQDAYLPDAPQMPWAESETEKITSPLGPEAFSGVHVVEVAGS